MGPARRSANISRMTRALGALLTVACCGAHVGMHLSDRVSLANGHAPDLFISVHANSMPTRRLRERTRGIETFFLSANASGAEAASTADRENAEGPTSRT